MRVNRPIHNSLIHLFAHSLILYSLILHSPGGLVATVYIPSLMRDLTGGQVKVNVPGRTVAQVIDALEAAYPGVKARVADDDRLADGVAVAVDGVIARLGLRAPVKAESALRFLPIIEGG